MPSINHLFHIQADMAKIHEAISTVEGLKRWWTSGTELSNENEISFSFGGIAMCSMKVIEHTENRYVWECISGAPDWIGTLISFDLLPVNGKIQLKFSHSKWPEQNDFYANCNFSWGRYLSSLRDYCEAGVGKPFT